jgi:fibronectin-binding autotransporter adhesin
MADRFWRGGTAAWDGTAGTKWADTAGGAAGAAVPTSADDVYFDATSSGTCTISSGNTGAKSINCTGFTGTLAGSAAITVSGSVTLDAGMTVTYSGTLTLNGTGTITSAGKTFAGSVFINGSGITVTLGDDITVSLNLVLTQGTFTTANFNVTAAGLSSSNTNTRTFNLGSSTVSLTGSSPINFVTNTNLTFNAGTSSINCSAAGSSILVGGAAVTGVTFYNVSATNTTANTFTISGVNTFNNLTITAPSSAGVAQVTFDSRQTIAGTLSTSGTAGNRRVWFRGVTYGIAQTLTINAAPSLTDADFRDIYVIGTAAPISGTRVGDLRGCRGITFDTPKSVYWVTLAGGSWSGNNWAASSGGAASTDNFPLAQDTVVIENTGLNTSATVTLDAAVPYLGTIDMSTRTNAMTLAGSTAYTVYGDWKFGSGVTRSYSGALTFSGRNTQTITSAGKSFAQAVAVDTYGGSVELVDDLNIGTNTLTITNGTFDTKNCIVTAGSLSSNNSNVRAITLGSSTVTLNGNAGVAMFTSTNLTFSGGTSTINLTETSAIFDGGSQTYSTVNFTSTASTGFSISGTNTFANLSVTATSAAGLSPVIFFNNQTITGTLTVAGATAVRRIFVRSDTLGTTRTLTVGTLAADDCDFRDITIAGTAAGSSPTRAGDCGGNSGITFPAAKTVYWNLAGAQNWSATAWAPSSGGSPDINNFPLAQDTAVFDEAAGSVTGTITINAAWNIGTFDASLRTSAMTLTTGSNAPFVYGDWKFGTGVTSSSTTGTITFAKRGTQTITSNGVTFGCPVTVNSVTGTTQLADALSIGPTRTLTLTSGTFDAVSYNVTAGLFTGGGTATLKMGSGTWTLSGTGSVWNMGSAGTNFNLYKGTANILFSDTSTSARTFDGSGFSFNKLTIGGATGISTTTIGGSNAFTELASTKTVAHTIALGSTTQTFGKWTVTGTAGNVVTLTGTGTSHILAGACTDSIDYLAMGSIGFAATSPGEFYAGANSTATSAVAPVYLTAKPADSTRYWVGGTGNWSDTARWSTGSGGASGASVPRSHDDVVFDSLSNATAYTATVDAVTGGIRTKALTIAGPLVGNVTLAGSAAIVGIHGNVTLPATGLTRTYTGAITLSGSTSGLTLTTNGVTLASSITVNGVGCEWTLGFALDIGSSILTVTNGLFDCDTYNLAVGSISSDTGNSRTIDFGSGTITISSTTATNFGTTETNAANLTITAGTSQINCTNSGPVLAGNGKTFYNVAFTSTSAGTVTLSGANTFNDLSFTGITSAGLKNININTNQTITGTFTCSAGTNATMRHFVRSNTIGTTRTLTCAAVSLTDVDFRDITIAGVAAPATGTRIGDCKGNSGITFTAAANKYWNLAAGGNWGGAIGWATGSGGTPNINDFPLAQDTCFFEATGLNSGATITVNAAYNIGTIDMSARTTNTMTLTRSVEPTIYGNWINGTGVSLSNNINTTFSGRTSQTLTSAGQTFTGGVTVNSPSGSLTLQDAFTSNATSLTLTSGTFDANTYSVTMSAGSLSSSNSNTRTIAVGSGTWTLAGSGTAWNASTSTNLTVTGTGTISLTSASAKTFGGGGASYSSITLNQGGAGTLTISGNNTFANITNTYKATGATSIGFGTTTQRVGSFTAAGEAGRVLTLTGTSAASPATLVLTSGTVTAPDYLTITGIRAYDLNTTWYAGANSTNNGSLGWLFESAPPPVVTTGVFLIFCSL